MIQMFDFLKKKKGKITDIGIDIDTDEDIEELGIEEVNKDESKEEKNNLSDVDRLLDSLEYTNSYLAQIYMILGELAKQQTIANALNILDSEYNNADSLMKVDEILEKKYALFSQIFVDYQVKQQEEENNG